jgi:pimeloyl-ACP methyl ester carboxylesterase
VSTVTLLLHGAGSCPATALALLSPAVAPGSYADALTSFGDADATAEEIEAASERHRRLGRRVVRVAGISLGAHAAVVWAAATGAEAELVLVMPAWTGGPGAVAAATVAAADEVERVGARAVLDRLRADPAGADDWVVAELARGWSTYDDDALVRTLRAAGASRGPTADELRRVAAPAAVVALADDPLHPEAVARDWAATLPSASLAVVERHAPARDRGALGSAAARILMSLSGSR